MDVERSSIDLANRNSCARISNEIFTKHCSLPCNRDKHRQTALLRTVEIAGELTTDDWKAFKNGLIPGGDEVNVISP